MHVYICMLHYYDYCDYRWFPLLLFLIVNDCSLQYMRLEESEPLSPALERSLVALHDTIALTSPHLLPLVGRLGTELKTERARSVFQRASMMAAMQKQQYDAAAGEWIA